VAAVLAAGVLVPVLLQLRREAAARTAEAAPVSQEAGIPEEPAAARSVEEIPAAEV
jgi:hypothetical protein